LAAVQKLFDVPSPSQVFTVGTSRDSSASTASLARARVTRGGGDFAGEDGAEHDAAPGERDSTIPLYRAPERASSENPKIVRAS
jgi:hypothetical protein